jgi:hypothetical protein
MAINDPVADVFRSQQNPFVGIYSNPITEAKKKKMVGLSGPKDVVAGREFLANGLWDLGSYNTPTSKITGVMPSSEEVIGRPDAQNTAQRSKSVSSGMKDAYDAVAKAKDLVPKPEKKELTPEEQGFKFMQDYQGFQKKWSNVKGNPFTGEKRDAFEARLNNRQLTPKQQAIYSANQAEFDAILGNIEAAKKPFGDQMSGIRSIMPMGESRTKGQLGQSSSTANVARYGEKEYTSPTMIPQNVSKFETMGFGTPKGYSTSTQAPLNLPMTQGQLDEEEAAKARAIIENHSQGYNQY